ncbi:hypothetical protein [Dyadobacter sediminis]|uniref:SGNH/GDSL hydrolase family protein n=1 Tax=Dyadobacter sediminis TaxID=1493691 RepID=A0A5R9K659_9BACT|nr:hypothetical protein [Dyadobacter sediminis]TLU89138.1 hypothetical protein FEM55_23920 [Dyadobacter sediminis]GGC02525.1 hypothetical protein GCM10011325_31970 [Dyadobacter sediminis]
MKIFLAKILFIVLVGCILGEIIARVWHLNSDIPQRYLDSHGIQKYVPEQTGYWKGGSHQWHINKLGWAGKFVDSNDSLVTIIGDSFIENFMNPENCHQDALLKNHFPQVKFLEAGRSGVSFIEALEIADELDSLHVKLHLIYVNNEDFTESISNLNRHSDIMQVDLEQGKMVPAVMKMPGLKKILYSCKFAYYLYNRFGSSKILVPGRSDKNKIPTTKSDQKERYTSQLLAYVKEHYQLSNKVIIFHPSVSKALKAQVFKTGFKTIALNSDKDKEWTFVYDHHWNCYGHSQAAAQVAKHLKAGRLL